MNELNRPITFAKLLTRCPRIEVPLIQRDYAQGRGTEKEVRDDFLKALHDALTLPIEKYSRPLNLDFIYGSMEQGESGDFLPLDGQQRLTTLFLLHWYLAWRDGRHTEFEKMLRDGKRSRFAYAVRPSSTEFFDQLVCYMPDVAPDHVPSVRRLLEDQPWFFLHWRLDPTIQSVVVVLDAIHQLFRSEAGLFARLLDELKPAITFQLLPLKHFGLTDDLYIKMNARGKPLTPFETFKARFEALLKELFPTERRSLGGAQVSVAEFFERRIDTAWTDLFWMHRDLNTHAFDDRLMNLLVTVARVTMNPEGESFHRDTWRLRERGQVATFSLFHEHGWLTRDFSLHLIGLLETWSGRAGGLKQILPNTRYFDEASFFEDAITEPARLGYVELVQFAAFVFYLAHHEGDIHPIRFNEWMRVVRNLAANSAIERPEEYGRALAGLRKLIPHSAAILERLCDTDIGQIGFSPQQVGEEVLKAQLILSNAGWKERIEKAEDHGYFSGQIEFLLDFCGAVAQAKTMPSEWGGKVQAKLQADFDNYSKKTEITFNSSGLAPTESSATAHLWKRAMLCVGDYLPSSGSNYSFLTNPPANWDSWKRFLRDGAGRKRQYLKMLWDRLDATEAIPPQLEQVIASTVGLEPWRAAIVRNPEVISYCGQQEIRKDWSGEIYLLRKKQMRGYHAELFSYALYLELTRDLDIELSPLKLRRYEEVYMTGSEPHILLACVRPPSRMSFAVESAGKQFRIHARIAEPTMLPEVEAALCDGVGFTKEDSGLMRQVPHANIHEALHQVAQALRKLSK